MQDPQSLHKYLYVHGDPINGRDPTGMFLPRILDLLQYYYEGIAGAAIGMNYGIWPTDGFATAFVSAIIADAIFGVVITIVGGAAAVAYRGLKRMEALPKLFRFLKNSGKSGRRYIADAAEFVKNFFRKCCFVGETPVLCCGGSLHDSLFESFGLSDAPILKSFDMETPGFNAVGSTHDRAFGAFGLPQSTGLKTLQGPQTKRRIDSIVLGNRVVGKNPNDWDRSWRSVEPNEETWRKILATVSDGNGTVTHVELLRSAESIDRQGIAVGAQLEFAFEEESLDGTATVEAILPCPSIDDGDGNVVTGVFVSTQRTTLVTVTLDDGSQIQGTGDHLVWSPTDDDWTRLKDLAPGMVLDGVKREVVVATIAREVADTKIYNLEIDVERVYRVGEPSVLAHNTYCEVPRTRVPKNHGAWSEGVPGDGKWLSDNPDILAATGNQPIVFKGGRPDFSPHKVGNDLEFDPGLLDGTQNDMALVYKELMDRESLPTQEAARQWLINHNPPLTPHHASDTVIEFIPSVIHGNRNFPGTPHIGSASDMRHLLD